MIQLLLPIIGTLVDRLIPDNAESEQVKNEITAKVMAADLAMRQAQLEVNKAEISTGRLGWRWGMGWLCVGSLAYAWVLRPLLSWALMMNGITEVPPALDTGDQYAIVTAMLGLSGVRAHDLLKGTRK